MSTNCTLYRSNRITPIYTLLNYTCLALGSQFGILIDQFWEVKDYRDGQFKSEVERFGIFLRQRIDSGVIANPFVGELLDFELARNELEFTPRKQVLRTIAHLGPPEADTPCRLHPGSPRSVPARSQGAPSCCCRRHHAACGSPRDGGACRPECHRRSSDSHAACGRHAF